MIRSPGTTVSRSVTASTRTWAAVAAASSGEVCAAAGTAGAMSMAAMMSSSEAGRRARMSSITGRRVAIINDALLQIGPPLAIEFAKAGHDLVIAQPQEGLVEKLEGLGSKVVVIEGVEQEGPNDETNPEHAQKFVDAAIQNFGGFDSAYFRTALHGGADILNVTKEQLQKSFESNFVAVVSEVGRLQAARCGLPAVEEEDFHGNVLERMTWRQLCNKGFSRRSLKPRAGRAMRPCRRGRVERRVHISSVPSHLRPRAPAERRPVSLRTRPTGRPDRGPPSRCPTARSGRGCSRRRSWC